MSTRGSLGKKTCPAEELARESTNRRVLRRFAWPRWPQRCLRSFNPVLGGCLSAKLTAERVAPAVLKTGCGHAFTWVCPRKGTPPPPLQNKTKKTMATVSFFGSALFCFTPKGGPIKRHTHMEGEEPSKRDTRRNPGDTAEAVGSGLSACRASLGGQRDAERVRRAWVLGVSRLLKFQHTQLREV